ncbi:hypothetical protein ABK040_004480 [Willaertia magna]
MSHQQYYQSPYGYPQQYQPVQQQQQNYQQEEEYDEDEGGEMFQQGGYSQSDIIPSNLRQLRACITCGLVKTAEQFKTNGCENCPHVKSDPSANTSTSFEGLICSMAPQKSWVARYQGIQDKAEGVYAITVHGSNTE